MSWNIYKVNDFCQHKDAWQDINKEGANTPLLDTDLITPLIKEFSTGQEILAVYSTGNTHPQAMALLTRKRLGVWETFQPSQAPLGAWVMKPTLAIDELLGGLLKALPGLPLVIGVTQQDPDITPRPNALGALSTLDYIQTARITTSTCFDEYWAARGKNLRHNMKRQRSRLEKEGVVTRLETLTGPDKVRTAIENYGRLESAGWKNEMGTAIHPDNAQGRFYMELLERFSRTGDARIYQYWYGDKLVAIDLCIIRNGVLIILKTTYDEDQKTSSPAFLMREESFKQIFEDKKIQKIEFYGKLMDWHTKWSNEIRTMYHINYYRWPFLAKLNHIR